MEVTEVDIDKYFIECVSAAGGITKRIQYRGERGCADHLTGFPYNRLFLVELKRPKGGRIRKLQHDDAKRWFHVGVKKIYLRTTVEIDNWIARVRA